MERIILAFATEKSPRPAHPPAGVRRPRAPPGCCFSGAEAIRTVRKLGSAVVICGFQLRDMTAELLAADLPGIAPVLVLSSPADLDLCEGENLVKLPVPATRAEFFASVELCARGALTAPPPAHPSPASAEEQHLIRRAKALLMEVNRMSEAEAHRFLQKYSMDAGAKLAETARLILERYTG